MFKHLTVILAFLMTIGSPVVAQDFQKGLAAAKAGDYATALQEWTPLAEAGDAKAQNKLGVMYDNGLGVPQDYLEALKWFRMAAEQGHADAQHSLGLLDEDGPGAGAYAKAVKWYRLAAEQGHADAQYRLGIMCEEGRGVMFSSRNKARKWYRLAAQQGYSLAQFALGRSYRFAEDYQEALKWYRLAAEQGDNVAQYELGNMYRGGEGVPQDNVMSHVWYNIAAANGLSSAGRWRNLIASSMTNADISKAQAMARECMESGYTKCGYLE
jgi:TPR repeat protein